MPPSEPTTGDLPGGVLFRGTTTSSETVAEPDTEVVVTDEVVAVHPKTGRKPDTPVAFTIPLEAVRRVRCEGFICRRIVLETADESYAIQAVELDELRFRRAIVENAGLTNTCMRLNLDRFGICPCRTGTLAGCLVAIVGIATIITVVGAPLGVVLLTVGIGLLLLTYLARAYGSYRGANVWEGKPNESEATA